MLVCGGCSVNKVSAVRLREAKGRLSYTRGGEELKGVVECFVMASSFPTRFLPRSLMESKQHRILTYNILSPSADLGELFSKCNPENVDPFKRLQRIKEKLEAEVIFILVFDILFFFLWSFSWLLS
jgi:hypothetical protein